VDWVYLVLILAFVSWSFQMFIAYKRQATHIDGMIEHARRTQAETSEEADRYEAQAEELKEQQKALEDKAGELEGKETEIQSSLVGTQENSASRRPTRHRVDGSESEA
jgi:chromosome segregation ATPase